MTTYRGPAVFLAESGQRFDADANLTSTTPDDWGGTLTFHDSTMVQALLKSPDGHVLIGGQSGEVSRRGAPTWSPTTGDPFVIDVFGAGLAPF
ncbi:hypothetical protein OG233_27745 [Streptomyces sp. NBC_01218]|uniref:hypothetical protein n=1 Tax=Streptomyces sp. NBC_01218 TaxID=2903780 RepID=UPI002E140145|nr:hypothetical protein OG233_27745 [Streptomyces sp. NBC_01218]